MQTHHRHSVRLPGYDYTQPGAYFITLCAHQRECLFGDIDSKGVLTLSAIGQIVAEEWRRSALIRREIQLDAFVVMPNHVHGIAIFTSMAPEDIEACGDVGAHGRAPLPRRPRSLGAFIAGFKSSVTARILWCTGDGAIFNSLCTEYYDAARMIQLR